MIGFYFGLIGRQCLRCGSVVSPFKNHVKDCPVHCEGTFAHPPSPPAWIGPDEWNAATCPNAGKTIGHVEVGEFATPVLPLMPERLAEMRARASEKVDPLDGGEEVCHRGADVITLLAEVKRLTAVVRTCHLLIVESCATCATRIVQAFSAPPTEAQIALAIESIGGMTCARYRVVAVEIDGPDVSIHIDRD